MTLTTLADCNQLTTGETWTGIAFILIVGAIIITIAEMTNHP